MYGDWHQLQNRWRYSLVLAMILTCTITLEILFAGWRNSTLRQTLQFKKTNRWDLFSLSLNFLGGKKILSNLFALGLIGCIEIGIVDSARDGVLSWPFWLKTAMAMITYDFILYWNHRFLHENDWLWNLHEYHHSGGEVNLLSDYRVHPLDYLTYFPFVAVTIIVLYSGQLKNFWGYAWIETVPGIFAHCRIDTHLGWVGKYLVVTPRFHHLHHSRETLMRKNYGHFLVIWDRLFGTYQEPVKSIHDLEQGLRFNPYETLPPVQAFLRPVWRFYKMPFQGLRRKLERGFR